MTGKNSAISGRLFEMWDSQLICNIFGGEKITAHHFLRIKPSTIFVWFVEQWGNQLICIFIAGTIGREQKLHLCLDGRTTWSIYNLLSVEHNRLLRHIKNYRYHLEKKVNMPRAQGHAKLSFSLIFEMFHGSKVFVTLI